MDRLNRDNMGMLAKPEYPVIDKNPPFTKTVGNFSVLDYIRLSTITGVSIPVGYLAGGNCNLRGPSMVTAGLIGLMGGFMYAYQNSAGRLMGLFLMMTMLLITRRRECYKYGLAC